MEKFKLILFTALLFLICYTSFGQLAEAEKAEIQQILDDYNIPGAAIALIEDARLQTAYFGVADIENQIPVSDLTQFGVGSIAKSFLALAVLHAHEEDILDIEAPISTLVPQLQFSNQWEETHPVRLIHLLEHTSGFDEAHFNLFAQANSTSSFSEVINLSQKSLVARWKPGNFYAYNNLGYLLAAYVLEEKSGKPFETYVRQNILLPLQMEKASYHPSATTHPHLAKAYSGNENVEEPFPSLPQWPAGSLVTTTEGMVNIIQMLLNQGNFNGVQIVDSASVLRMETAETSVRAQKGIIYEYGKGLMKRNEKVHLFYGHSGSYGGFLSDFGYSRELKKGYVIMLNSSEGNKAIKAIKEVLLRDIVAQSLEENDKVFSSQPKANITDAYQPITTNFELSRFAMRLIDIQFIVEKDGQVYRKSIVGDEQLLIPMGGGKFRKQHEAGASMLITKDNGDQYFLDETAYVQIPVWSAYLQFYSAVISLLVMIFSFLALLFVIPYRLLKKSKTLSLLPVLQFLTALCFLCLPFSIAFFYDPTKLYSVGAVVFYVSSWLFLLLSITLVLFTINQLMKKSINKFWAKLFAVAFSLSSLLITGYLAYWGIIGLRLWDY